MKITFIIPPVLNGGQPAERSSGCTRVVYATPNIYELTVAALLEREGYKDIHYEDFVYNQRSPEEFRIFLQQDRSAVYCMWTVNLSIENDIMVADLIHQIMPEAYVLMMGPGPTYYTEKCLAHERTIVVRGEPDMAVCELVNALRDSADWHAVDGISYVQDGMPVHNRMHALVRNLDEIPFPARHFVDHQVYHNPKLKTTPYTTALTSRSCPFKCIYCVPSSLTFAREIENRKVNGKKPFVSFRSVENVEEEMKMLASQGYKAIGFMDDNFIWTEKRTLAICEVMKKYGLKWGCQARVDAITENIAKALGESGCLYVDLGVESFNDEILKFIRKGITQKQIYESIGLLKKYKGPVKLNILIGTSPLQTKETLKDTLRRAKALHVDQIMFNSVSPFPGTEFYTMAKENGCIETGDYIPTDVQRNSILSYPHLSAREMERILFRNNLSYFFSPYFIFSQLRRFTSWKEFFYALKVLKVKLFG